MKLIKFLVIAPISFLIVLGDSLLPKTITYSLVGKTTSNTSLIQQNRASIAAATSTNSTTIIAQSEPINPDRGKDDPPPINPDNGSSTPPVIPDNGTSEPPRGTDNERGDRPRRPNIRPRFDLLIPLILLNQPRANEREVFEQNFKRADINRAVQLFEEYQGKKFNQHLDLDTNIIPPTIAEISQTLSRLYQNTGKKPAFSYVVSLKDELHLIVILPNPSSISKTPQSTALLPSFTKNIEKTLGHKGKVYIAQSQTPNAERVVLKVSRKDLEKIAEQFRNKVLSKTSFKLDLTPAQTLYQAFISPLEANLKANNIDTLVISADSGLRSLPIAALYDGQQYLVEKYSYALVPTFRLANLRSPIGIKNKQVLAMGISKPTDGQEPLPAAKLEIDVLSNQIWQGERLLDEQTTVNNLKSVSHSQRFDIVHIATHADFKKGEANNSYIQFWNSKLKLKELRNLAKDLRWDLVEMLVLSACRTALGNEEAELGFAGLAVQAGTKTAVGSLWKVNDESTLGLITEFYSQLKTAPTKAEALRQAQIAMLRGEIRKEEGHLKLASLTAIPLPTEMFTEGEDFTHPYYWSAFTVIGNWN